MEKIKFGITSTLLALAITGAFATSKTTFLYFYYLTNQYNPPIPTLVDINCGEYGGECVVPIPGVGNRQLYRFDPLDGQLKRVGHLN